ncbi:MAG: carotenoid oxygenase family protein [Phenylobacterium sp.]|uniref:carotenoid oxygenase family protein n=1 Tax=Phenylobacterium sp. TaxID=1871053 RepID=UPI00273561F6|nr:carotenoid oxygenase family protein [Phenylobacterium sp.]MDP3748274.1 carotenoid oxygenase family protein [Phenylobacterium sp.]
MALPYPHDPLLAGAFEPIRMECDYADLPIEGALPAELEGALYRIGPNPQFAPRGPYSPLQGDGMIHAFHIARGRVAYRNRWVRTRQWELERAAGRALFATADPRDHDPQVAGVASQGAANTHIIGHAGRLLALEEGHPPIEIDPLTLETLGPYDFAGRLPANMTAHPKVDPVTGEMVFFANFPTRDFDGALALHVADAAGTLTRSIKVAGPYPALVHDFAITRDHVVFVVCPLTLSLARLRAGAPPIAWEPELGVHVGVMPRSGTCADVRWFAAPPCMVWHVLNAHGEDGRIHVDLCQQDAPAFSGPDGRPAAEASLRQVLTRWTVDPGADAPVSVRRLSEVVCEYPRIDERRVGLPYRYGYVAALGGPGTGDLLHRAIGRYDHATSEMALWRAPEHCAVSEPVFAAKPGASEEGVGYLLATVFDARRNASHLAVLDATNIEAGPIARAHLDHRVPAGFHGSFVVRQDAV